MNEFSLTKEPCRRRVAIAGESQDWWEHVETLKDDARFDLVMGYSRELSHVHASYFPANFTAIANARSAAHRRQHAWPEELLAQVFVGVCSRVFRFVCRVCVVCVSCCGRLAVGGFVLGRRVFVWVVLKCVSC